MKLVCFANNTAGGLMCDLLNNHQVYMSGYKTTGRAHSILKVGDTSSVQRTVDVPTWNSIVEMNRSLDLWVGTHCHPSGIPNLSVFDEVIAITTQTRESQFYRWLRYYHGWFKSSTPWWEENDKLDTIDAARNAAKNVFDIFEPHPYCRNIEFKDIVTGSFIRDNGLDIGKFESWQKANSFLYNFNDSDWAVKRFNEAEYEVLNNEPFRYY